jgi:hypothetical protein
MPGVYLRTASSQVGMATGATKILFGVPIVYLILGESEAAPMSVCQCICLPCLRRSGKYAFACFLTYFASEDITNIA